MRSLWLVAVLMLAVMALPGSVAGQAPEASPEASSEPVADPRGVAWVPVLRFWDQRREVALEEVRAAVEGGSEHYSRVVVGGGDPAALWSALEITPAEPVEVGSVEAVVRAVGSSRRALGLVPASAVRADMRALSVAGVSLFGGERISALEEWPLLAEGDGAFDPEATWTLIAGGDVMLDREPYRVAVIEGKGGDWLWDGGFARIISRTCCTVDGGPAISTRRVGPKGAVRELLSSADIAVVNHEAAAPDDHRYHPSGLIFTVDPDLLPGIAGAGIDIVSLANNHIRNAGSTGVKQTIRNMRAAGLRTVGAGRDPAAAHQPACFDQAETRVCLLGHNEVAAYANSASESRAGGADLSATSVKRDIRRARRDGADVIVLMPHWGAEYVTTIEPKQQRWARVMVKAGADVVLGNHSHVTGPIEFIDGVPVLYSMGDLVFDLPRFEATEEGVLVELTFHGAELAQVELHPTVIHDRAQVNLLERDGDGAIVIKRMRSASRRLSQE